MKKASESEAFFVVDTGFEPVTPTLSTWCSEPAELIDRSDCKVNRRIGICKPIAQKKYLISNVVELQGNAIAGFNFIQLHLETAKRYGRPISRIFGFKSIKCRF